MLNIKQHKNEINFYNVKIHDILKYDHTLFNASLTSLVMPFFFFFCSSAVVSVECLSSIVFLESLLFIKLFELSEAYLLHDLGLDESPVILNSLNTNWNYFTNIYNILMFNNYLGLYTVLWIFYKYRYMFCQNTLWQQ